MSTASSQFLDQLAGFDPAPLFVLSLLPYLALLWWASQVRAFPRLALAGFAFTLVFVAATIVASILAERRYGALLADVDPLHGGAEALLTLSNVLVLLGFLRSGSREDEQVLRPHAGTPCPPEDEASAHHP
jgi:hypothetical protein